MPELPEVQTVVDGLNRKVLDDKILDVKIHRASIVFNKVETFRKKLLDQKIRSVFRRGKYIIFELESGYFIVSHLRMTGKFIVSHDLEKHKFDRVEFYFKNKRMIFSDIRCFGRLEVLNDWKLEKGIQKLGIEPMSKEFSEPYLQKLISKSTQNIKTLLMDQRKIAGIGNIYASEILFDCKISPQKLANSISAKECRKLHKSVVYILSQGLKHNGTSISDFRSVDDKTGEFQNFLKVYGKKDQACCICSGTIQKITQQQRSTFFCKKCQN